MKLNDLKNKSVLRAMPMGRNEITFTGINYRIDDEENITGAFINCEEYRPLFIPIFEGDNFQLDLLTEQLGIDSYDPDQINQAVGTRIVAHKYVRFDPNRGQEFTNISFNPRYDETKQNNVTNIVHNYA